MNTLACTLALLVAGIGGGNPAPRPLPVVMQDDALLLHRSPADIRRAARKMADLGVDRVRITAGWSSLAPKPLAKKRPKKFDGRNPEDYPLDPSVRLDRAVKEVVAAGMSVQLDISFWAPRWAVKGKSPVPQRE